MGTDPGAVSDFENKLEGKAGDQTVAFVRVPQGAASTSKPPAWAGPRTSSIPNFGACKGAWKKVTHIELASSEAEAPRASPNQRRQRLVFRKISRASKAFCRGQRRRGGGQRRRGASQVLATRQVIDAEAREAEGNQELSLDLQQLIMKSLAEGGYKRCPDFGRACPAVGFKAQRPESQQQPRRPWWFQLRQLEQRRRRHDKPWDVDFTSQKDRAQAEENHRGFRGRHHPGAWHCSGAGMDSPRLREEAELGPLQGSLQSGDDGCRGL